MTLPESTNMDAIDLANFDPFEQILTLTVSGMETRQIPLSAIHEYATWAIKTCINYGSQLGACLFCLTLMLALTRGEKRYSPIFAANALGLFFNVVKNLVGCLYYTGPFWHPYTYFAEDYSRITQTAISNSIAEEVMYLLLVVCVQVSLVLQVHVVLVATAPRHKLILMAVLIVSGLVAVSLRFALTIISVRATISLEDASEWIWLASACNFSLTASISLFTISFCTKLLIVIRQRRQMHIRDFGPLQIIFVMGLQTGILPAIFAIVAYTIEVPMLSMAVPTVVLLSLPLSALWAASFVQEGRQNSWKPCDGKSCSCASSQAKKLCGNESSISSTFSHDDLDESKDKSVV